MYRQKAWFYNPQEDTSGFVNKLVSRLDPPFCHCELQFSDNQACSIYMGSNVVFKERAFQSSNYTSIDIECAAAPYQQMHTAAKKYAADSVGFSTLRMTASLAPIWVPSAATGNTTFCSELCANILRTGGLLPTTLDTGRVTPSGLEKLLKERSATTSSRAPSPAAIIAASPPVSMRAVAIGFK